MCVNKFLAPVLSVSTATRQQKISWLFQSQVYSLPVEFAGSSCVRVGFLCLVLLPATVSCLVACGSLMIQSKVLVQLSYEI